jgi:hypothetical protein
MGKPSGGRALRRERRRRQPAVIGPARQHEQTPAAPTGHDTQVPVLRSQREHPVHSLLDVQPTDVTLWPHWLPQLFLLQ